ncbi:phage portal protein [Pseudalkalibacillus caeni]|uniref:Phage portal protein n=1 Tax=Exobacillus caeni TaxID=2574798 RepID=A0A5R9F8M6_9BACL|nr:phage portal protein [Pseudalkalibacillus caeni]
MVDWFNTFLRGKEFVKLDEINFYTLNAKAFYKKLAIETCTDLIANALIRCEFKTFENGKEKRGENHYLLNVQPNQNQNASQFIHSLVTHLISDNECLVLMQDNQLYIAEEFERVPFAFKENIYKEISVKGLKLKKVFKESEVLYFQLNDKNIMNVINSLYEDYGKLIVSGMNYYKRKNNKRYLIKGDFLRAQNNEEQQAIDQMFESQMKNWFDPDKEGAAFQLQNSYEMDDLSDGTKSSSGNNGTSRDIRALVDDVIDFVATSLHVPRGLIKGDVADVEKQVDSFLMFCIIPLVKLITTEFNRKMYKKEDYKKRTYLKIDYSQIKIVDIVQLANAVDKLFAVGGLNIDDIQVLLGKEPLNTEWSQKRYVTKNYQEADSLEGGE